MASGKLTPRQKMINMMYLVLTALLALNISKDILEALTKLNASLDQTVQTVDKKNASIYSKFESAYAQDPQKTKQWRDMALNVKKESDELYTYIAGLKEKLVEVSGGYEEGSTTVPKSLDAREKPANYLLNEKHASELRKKIENYRSSIKGYANNDQLKSNIETTFSTTDQPVGEDKVMTSWEKANFEHFPLAAILPFLTDYQAKVRNTESDVISELQTKIGESDLKFTDVRVIVDSKSNYVTQGDEYEAEVFLAAYDATQEPVILVNGEALPADQISEGKGRVKFKADGVGEKKWGGKIKITQIGKGEVEYDIPEQSYTVAPPTAVISPTKMNVLYKGVDNPIEIGVPGVDPSKIRVSGVPLSGSNGNYIADVSNVSAREVNIQVSVEDTDEEGKKSVRQVGVKKFRIKGLPPATGMVFGKTEGIVSKSLLQRASVDAKYLDFPFDMDLNVVSFEIAIPGFPPEQVRGSSMTPQVKTRIDKLRPGQTVSIRNIKATGPKGVRVNQVGNISLDVN
ncbi:MAG: gliding motility protein GldM [Owenweeksia sp.]